MSEQVKILEMVEKGQLTASEAMELLNALNASEPEHALTLPGATKPKYKYLKIRVTSENNTVNVKVNIPIRLIKVIGGIATKMTSVIPKDARAEMESKGIDITSIDFSEIVEELLSGTLDDPSIVDVEAWDEEHDTTIIVKIYAE